MTLIADRFTPLNPLSPNVFVVRDQDGMPMVLKRLPEARREDPAAVLRFQIEAHRASRLSGPRLAPATLEGFEAEGPFYAMPYAQGPAATLVSPTELRKVVQQVASALHAIHAAGYVHAGLEPTAIRRTDQGVVLVGYGHLTPIGQACDRPGPDDYASPEQQAGRPLDGRADLWALGALIRYWLTGRSGPKALLHPESDEPLAQIALRLLEPEPHARFRDAEALLAALDVPEIGPTLRLAPSSVERPDAQEVFDQAMEALAASRGAAIAVIGPSGVGKSTLLDQWAASSPYPVLRARGLGPWASPLAPWAALREGLFRFAVGRGFAPSERSRRELATLFPTLGAGAYAEVPPGPSLEPEPTMRRPFGALAELLAAAAASNGLVIMLDDWDQADEASRAALAFVTARTLELPIAWVTASSGPVGFAATPYELPPMSREIAFAVVAGLLEDAMPAPEVETLVAYSAKHPGTLKGLIQHLISQGMLLRGLQGWQLASFEDWPTPEDLAERTLAALPGEAWEVAGALAALGPVVPLGWLGAGPAFASRARGLDHLLLAGIVLQGPEGLRFSQAAFGALCERSLSPEARRAAHQTALETLAPNEATRVPCAAQALGAEQPEALAGLALPAGWQLLARGGLSTARTLLEEGLVTLAFDDPLRSGYLMALGELARRSGDAEAATALFSEARLSLETPADRLRAALALGWLACEKAPETARDHFREAAQLAQGQGEVDALTWALAGLAEALLALGERDSAIEAFETALGIGAEASALPRARALLGLGALLAVERRERQSEGAALLQRAAATYEAEGETIALSRALGRLAAAEFGRGELRAASEAASRARALAEAREEALGAELIVAQVALAYGELERAGGLVRELRRRAEGLAGLLGQAIALEARVALASGQVPGEAAAIAQEALAAAHNDPAARGEALLAQSECLLAAGALPEAAGALVQAGTGLVGPEAQARRALLLGDWAAKVGDRERARSEYKSVLAMPNQWLIARAALALGRLASEVGARVEAAGWLEQARRGAMVLGGQALAQEAQEAEKALGAEQAHPESTPHDAAKRLKQIFNEARLLMPQLLAPGHKVEALEAQIRNLQALNQLWKRLFKAPDRPAAAIALTEAVFAATEAERVFVLGRALEPLASRARGLGALPFAPGLVRAELCRKAIDAGPMGAFDDGYLALPLLGEKRVLGVLYLVGVGEEAQAVTLAIAEAGAAALDRLGSPLVS